MPLERRKGREQLREWFPPTFDNIPIRQADTPFIWFPWFGKFDPDALKEQARSVIMRGPRRSQSQAQVRKESGVIGKERNSVQTLTVIEDRIQKFIDERTPECLVYEGDTISIARVEPKIVGKSLDHLHDRECRNVYLCIHRNGSNETKHISTPLLYIGVTAVLQSDISNTNFEMISRRITSHFKLASIRDALSVQPPLDSEEQSLAYRALRRAFAIVNAHGDDPFDDNSGEATIVTIRRPEEEFHDGSKIWYTINDALMMGYLWAKWEIDPAVKDHAAESVRQKSEAAQKTQIRVKASEKKRTDKKEAWHKVAAKLIDDFCERRSGYTNADMLETIRNKPERWATTVMFLELGPCMPSPSSLENFISSYMRKRRSKATTEE